MFAPRSLKSALHTTAPDALLLSARRKDAASRSNEKPEADTHSSSSDAAAIRDVIQRPGVPLDGATRSVFEPRFGHDFSHVRLHIDGAAASSARRIAAPAYAAGHHLVFDYGRFAPETQQGRRLIAHELAHVAQHPLPSSVEAGAHIRIGTASDLFERDAEMTAARVAIAPRGVDGPRTAPALSEAGSMLTVRLLGMRSPRRTASFLPSSDCRVCIRCAKSAIDARLARSRRS